MFAGNWLTYGLPGRTVFSSWIVPLGRFALGTLLGIVAVSMWQQFSLSFGLDPILTMAVGLVLSAEPVKGADKLLHMKIDIGEPEPRTIVAGIALAYKPEQMVGRKVVIVANLQPRKLRGIESNGMIVAGSLEGGKPVLAGFLEDVPVGARLK